MKQSDQWRKKLEVQPVEEESQQVFTLLLLQSCGAVTHRSKRQCLIQKERPQPERSGVTYSTIVSDRASTLQLFSGFQRSCDGGRKIGLKTQGLDQGLYGSWGKKIWIPKVKWRAKAPFCPITKGQMLSVTQRGQSSAEPLVEAHSGVLWTRWDEPPACLSKWHPDQ